MKPKDQSSDNLSLWAKIRIKIKNDMKSQLILVMFVVFVSMTSFEFINLFFFPTVQIRNSHIITIIFTTILAAIIAYLVLNEHEKIEKSLKESEKKYRQWFEDDLTGDFIATPKGKLLECNSSFVEIYGFANREEAMQSDISKFNPIKWADLIYHLKNEHKIKNRENWHKRPDRKQIYIISNVVGVFNDLGELIQVKGYVFDDTERKQAEEKLRQARGHLEEQVKERTAELKEAYQNLKENEIKYRFLYENAPVGIFYSTDNGKFIDANPELASMLGYKSPEELISTTNKTSIAEAIFVNPKLRPSFIKSTIEGKDGLKLKIFIDAKMEKQ